MPERSAAAEKSLRHVIVSSLYPMGGNYGGIMQAYALQQVILDLGYEVVTIDSPRDWRRLRSLARSLRYWLTRSFRRSNQAKPLTDRELRVVQAEPREFVRRHISTLNLFGISRRERKQVLSGTHAVVVGSDQVWRGGYADVLKQMLIYSKRYRLVRFSYAASFGADRPIRFPFRKVVLARKYIRQFNGVSVREDSGIAICENLWGIDAIQHVDPTLLLDRSCYLKLAGVDSPNQNGGRSLFAYTLNQSPAVNEIIRTVSCDLGLDRSEISLYKNVDGKGLKDRHAEPRMPSVESWIKNFWLSGFVVTDSFHGVAFSIIFRVPFIAVANEERGVARFESLLSLVGLESRLVYSDRVDLPSDLLGIDWSDVDVRLERERDRAVDYLKRMLLSEPRTIS